MARKSRDILPILTARARALFLDKLVHRRNGCIEYDGHCNADGYGIVRIGGVALLAHRVAWVIATGSEIPDGIILCHRCNNSSCCNVEHIYLGSHQDNANDRRDKYRGMTGRRGANHPRAKANDIRRRAIIMRSDAVPFSVISQELGIKRQTAERWWKAHVEAMAAAMALRRE